MVKNLSFNVEQHSYDIFRQKSLLEATFLFLEDDICVVYTQLAPSHGASRMCPVTALTQCVFLWSREGVVGVRIDSVPLQRLWG